MTTPAKLDERVLVLRRAAARLRVIAAGLASRIDTLDDEAAQVQQDAARLRLAAIEGRTAAAAADLEPIR